MEPRRPRRGCKHNVLPSDTPAAPASPWAQGAKSRNSSPTARPQRTGAFALDQSSTDAAILLHLPEGGYVALVTAMPGTPGGVALAELYTNVGYEVVRP